MSWLLVYHFWDAPRLCRPDNTAILLERRIEGSEPELCFLPAAHLHRYTGGPWPVLWLCPTALSHRCTQGCRSVTLLLMLFHARDSQVLQVKAVAPSCCPLRDPGRYKHSICCTFQGWKESCRPDDKVPLCCTLGGIPCRPQSRAKQSSCCILAEIHLSPPSCTSKRGIDGCRP